MKPSKELISLAGRRAVVTGAGRGLGSAIAARLAEAGAFVLLADIDASTVERTASELTRAGGTVAAVQMDVGNSASTDDGASRAEELWGGIDIWVNNAAVLGPTGPIGSTDDDRFDRIVAVNLKGGFNGARAAARIMKERAVIVNIASTTALRAHPFSTPYVCSKAALIGVTKALAVELGSRGIRVIAVAPGFVRTPGSQQSLGLTDDQSHDAALTSRNPLKYPLAADDVARVVLFCASDLAAGITGVVVPVDGGSIL